MSPQLSALQRNKLGFFFWLRKLIYLWVRTKIVPQNPLDELGIDPTKPVCYILSNNSLSDLMVLDEQTRRLGLPIPRHRATSLRSPGAVAFISLQRTGLLQMERGTPKDVHGQLLSLIEQAKADPSMEVQLVPTSVFWGRNPGKDEKSVLKLAFFDDEHAGMLQKMFIVIAQGRSNFIQFGKPISLRNLVDEGASAPDTTKKLRRVVRVHFRRQRTGALGPSLPTRSLVAAHLLKTRTVREAIAEEARKKKITLNKAEVLARKYVQEIASEQQYSMVRLFDLFLSYVWRKIFDGIVVRHGARLRELDQTHEFVYLPSHRSHLDYLLFSYSIYYEGFVPPHIAAGINLDFWPLGPLLRRGGAFFLRRTFGGNRLYTAVFNEYMHYLLTKGHPVKFYLEGGRSRTGRLLAPKTGMLAMVVQSFFRDSTKPIVLIPVYIGYDKVMEVRTYQSELRGAKKSKESVSGLMKARRVLKNYFGKAYIGFGEPLHLAKHLDERHPAWREETKNPDEKPKWLHPFVLDLADQVMTRVNSTAVVSPLAIFALVLLSSQQKAMAEEELLYMMEKLVSSMRAAPYSRDVSLPDGTTKDWLKHAMSVCKAERFHHPIGDVIHLDERESVLLTYYRNNVLHLVAMPSLVASFFQHNETMTEDTLVSACARLYPFLQAEFFLRWPPGDAEKVARGVIEALVSEKLLFRHGPELRRPDFTSQDFASLKILGRALGQTLERYAVSAALLAQHADGNPFLRKDFETRCQLMAQRISILNGRSEPEFFDKNLFKTFVDRLKDLGLAHELDEGRMTVDPRIASTSAQSLGLLSTDIRQSILRMTSTEAPGGPV